MKSALIGSTVGLMAGMSIGFAAGVWLMAEVSTGCEPKYRLQDFPKVPPAIRQNGYGHEPRINTFHCIGGEKDCGVRPTEIPEPGTLLLVGAGLLAVLKMTPNRQFRHRRTKSLAAILFLSGCAAAPHLADTGISGAVIASGGAELNPLGFPAVIVAKIAAEGAAEAARNRGERMTCTQIAGAARYGSWIGTGATLGGLAGGPIGMGVGALVAIVAAERPSLQSAVETCYSPRGGSRVLAGPPAGWNG